MKVESAHHPERENRMEKVHRFFDIDTAIEGKLKEAIKQSGGLVRVFIHPDFEKYTTFDSVKGEPKQIQQLKDAQEVFESVLTSKSESVPPVFIFESGWSADDFKRKEEVLKKLSFRDIYIVRTEGANPNPLPPDFEERGLKLFEGNKISDTEREEMWIWFIDELKRWGVKKILIGGLEFYVREDEKGGHSGCLGVAIERLKNYFEIEISHMTWPEKIHGLKKEF